MYCTNCASEVKPELHYCNNCGYRISGKAEKIYDPVSKTLSSSLGYIGVFSVIGFVFLIKSLLDYDIADGRLVALAFIYLAAIFGIVFLILQKIGSGKTTEPQNISYSPEKSALKSADTNQLEAPKEPPASVTVNTTRTLDEVQLDRD